MRDEIKSNPGRYSTVAAALHWLTALAVMAAFVAGMRASHTSDPVHAASILRLHVPLALLAFALTIFRLAWWTLVDRLPEPLPMPVWQRIIATVVHRGLNILVLALGLSGIGLFVQSGVAAVVFGGNGGNLPNFDDFPARYVHGAFARLLFLLLALHIFAAFFHQFAKRDRIFARIGIGRP